MAYPRSRPLLLCHPRRFWLSMTGVPLAPHRSWLKPFSMSRQSRLLRGLPATSPAPNASIALPAARPGSARDLAEQAVVGTTSYTAPTCLQIFPVTLSPVGSAGPPPTGWSLTLLWTSESPHHCQFNSSGPGSSFLLYFHPRGFTATSLPTLLGKRAPCLQEPIPRV